MSANINTTPSSNTIRLQGEILIAHLYSSIHDIYDGLPIPYPASLTDKIWQLASTLEESSLKMNALKERISSVADENSPELQTISKRIQKAQIVCRSLYYRCLAGKTASLAKEPNIPPHLLIELNGKIDLALASELKEAKQKYWAQLKPPSLETVLTSVSLEEKYTQIAETLDQEVKDEEHLKNQWISLESQRNLAEEFDENAALLTIVRELADLNSEMALEITSEIDHENTKNACLWELGNHQIKQGNYAMAFQIAIKHTKKGKRDALLRNIFNCLYQQITDLRKAEELVDEDIAKFTQLMGLAIAVVKRFADEEMHDYTHEQLLNVLLANFSTETEEAEISLVLKIANGIWNASRRKTAIDIIFNLLKELSSKNEPFIDQVIAAVNALPTEINLDDLFVRLYEILIAQKKDKTALEIAEKISNTLTKGILLRDFKESALKYCFAEGFR